MLYQLCPRCHFKIPASKHVCLTCGMHVSPIKPGTKPADVQPETQAARVAADTSTDSHNENQPAKSFWRTLLGLDLHEPDSEKKDSGVQDKALGET